MRSGRRLDGFALNRSGREPTVVTKSRKLDSNRVDKQDGDSTHRTSLAEPEAFSQLLGREIQHDGLPATHPQLGSVLS